MTDTGQERPRLSEFTRPSTKRPQDNEPSPEEQEAAVASEQRDDAPPEGMMPPESPAEVEAQDRLKLYEQMQDTMSPIENYKKYLEGLGIDEEDAATIVDNIMTNGFHEETFKLSKTRTCTLRTREHRDTVRLQTAMQIQRPLFQDSLNELQTRYNMAASLSAYNGENYYFPEPKDALEKVDKLFDERLSAVECLPAPMFSVVSLLLAKFDQKIAAVLRPGVAENF